MTKRLMVLVSLLTVLGSLGVSAPAAADSDDPQVQQLADRYAPIVMVKAQDGPCDSDGEPFEPAPVDIVLDNPEVFLRQVGNDDPVAMRAPGAADLFDLQGGWYLDFPGDGLNPDCIFETDYRRFSADLPSVVYAHVATEDDEPGMLALQYWFFWYHNSSKNNHEGDWEFMQLVFDVDTVEEALQTEPVAIGLAQHEGGERAEWGDPKLELDGTRPVVYPSKGSHATYFAQAVYLGRSDEFFGCDNTDAPSRRVDPEVVVLPDEVTDADDEFAWLTFLGRWGQRERAFFNGPTGPIDKDQWHAPITWQEELRDSSVVVPAGDRYDSVVSFFCSGVEQGSLLLVSVFRSPVLVFATLFALFFAVRGLIGRTAWSPVTTRPLRERRAVGQMLRAAFRIARRRPLTLVTIGLIVGPLAVVIGFLQWLVQRIPIVRDLVDVAGEGSETGAGLVLVVGSLGSAIAYVFVAGAVAAAIDRPHPDRTTVGQAIGPLTTTFVRAAAIVFGLGITVVGIPWAIRQAIRYQLAPQVVVLEGLSGKEALGRSSELVRGRWWWTAGVVVVMQGLIGLIGLVFALLVLILLSSMPLWLFSIISSLVSIIVLPLFGAMMAYVYGDHVALRDKTRRDETRRDEVRRDEVRGDDHRDDAEPGATETVAVD